MTVRDDVAVSIVGLGEMGSAIARAFLTSEYGPCGTDPPERAAQLMDDLIGSWKARRTAAAQDRAHSPKCFLNQRCHHKLEPLLKGRLSLFSESRS